jgi:4-alpha-glucanotransferase
VHFDRSSGVLLHVTSLPTPYGIGDLGPGAHSWVDWLTESGCRYWQILPIGPTGFADSPYSSFSSFAGNPNLISPDLLVADGLLAQGEASKLDGGERVDYGVVIPAKVAMVDLAYSRLSGGLAKEFDVFRAKEAEWLEPYSLFMALKQAHGGGSWTNWPLELRTRDPEALSEARRDLGDAIDRHAFAQYLFYRQLEALRAHASDRGVSIIGDVPLYVAPDSVDVWLDPELFAMDMDSGTPSLVAGVPPDMFSDDGQWWGNPLYRWEVHAADGFTWWAQRLQAFFRQADVLRIDHFTGLVRYYELDGASTSARDGVWRDGPGAAFFDALKRRIGDRPFILEDLGPLGQVVEELRRELGYPGMKVLQEAFDGDPDNIWLPENYPEDSVVYTGTHDFDTVRGRFDSGTDDYRLQALDYTGATPETYPWALIKKAWESVAVIAMTSMQDLLGLGTEARMNYPSTTDGNWQWRMTEGAASPELAGKLAALNRKTARWR